MRNLSRTAKTLLAGTVLLSLLVFGVVVDFGVNAGVVHHGVTISGLDVGGLTLDETRSALNDHRRRMRHSEVCFSGPGFADCFLPQDVGWFPTEVEINASALEAFEVGRNGGPFVALGERLRAWSRGVDLTWPHSARPAMVTKLIDEWERELLQSDLRLDRARTRAMIKDSLRAWPRRKVPIPIL